MKRLFKITGLGLALWGLSLIWLELNIILLWPLFAGLVAGTVPAYLLGMWFNRLVVRPRPAAAAVTRPTRRSYRHNPSIGPTRPSPRQSPRERAAASTRPMPVL